MFRIRLLSALVSLAFLFGLPAFAQTVPSPLEQDEAIQPIKPPENTDEVVETNETLDRLFENLKRDPKYASASATARMIWREWSASGSRSIDLLMNWAARAISRNEYAKALDLLDQVLVLAPDYAEGWNRRATLYYTMNDFGNSISDIESTLALEPRHFGALSGLAVILQRVGNNQAALKTWYRVLAIYPANKQAQESVIMLEEELSGSPT